MLSRGLRVVSRSMQPASTLRRGLSRSMRATSIVLATSARSMQRSSMVRRLRLMLDAARIDFASSGLTIDAACIDAAGECLVWTARGLAIDAACIDAEAWPVPIDESHIDRACDVSTIDAALIDGETAPSHARCSPHRFRQQRTHDRCSPHRDDEAEWAKHVPSPIWNHAYHAVASPPHS